MTNRELPLALPPTDVSGYDHIIKNNLSFVSRSGSKHIVTVNRAKSEVSNNSFDGSEEVVEADFISLEEAELMRDRKPNGDLPDVNFGKLTTDAELRFWGMGCFATGEPTDLDFGWLKKPTIVVVGSKGLGVALDDAKDVDLHGVGQGSRIQKVRLRDQVGHILDVAQLRQSGCAVATIQGGIQTGDSSTHRMFTSLVSVNHSVLSDCCPIAAINPIDGIVVQPIQRGKRFAIKVEWFENRIHDSNDRTCFCNATCVLIGVDPHTQGNGGVFAVTSRINVYRQITVFFYLHTRNLLCIAVIDFTSNKDAGNLLSQFLSNSSEDRIEIINQLFQTSLHVAST